MLKAGSDLLINCKNYIPRQSYRSGVYKRDIWSKMQNKKLYNNETKCKAKDRTVKNQKISDYRSKDIIIISRILFLN